MQPVMNIKRQFRCHVRHSLPSVLYTLFYYVQVPSLSTATTTRAWSPRFQATKIHRTVTSRPGDPGFSQRGRYDVDFLTAVHDTRLELLDDFVLTGLRADHDEEERWNYSVRASTVKTPPATETSSVHTVSQNVSVASVQTHRPFSYSTSTWVGACGKNISVLRQIGDEREGKDNVQQVDATVRRTSDGHFSYLLKSATYRPYIRFTVPDGKSVLPYFFRDSKARLLVNESLSVSLKLSSGGRVWLIHVSGEMTDCPSYLGVTINDRLQSEQLIKYDLLVFCPPQFNVTFWLPNWGQRSAKTFDVHLRDSERTHVVYLTQLLLDPAARQSTPTTKSPIYIISDDRDLSTLFAAATGVTLTVLLLLVTLFIRLRSQCLSGTPSSTDGARQRRGRPCRVCVYVTVRVVYSVVVSFAAVLLTLGVLVQPEVDLMTSVEDRLSAVSRGPWIVDVDRAAGDEALRQARDATSRHSACTHYVNQLYTVVVDRVARVRSNRSWCVGGSDRDAVRRLDGDVRRYAAATWAQVDDYSQHVSTTVSTLTSARKRHLAQLYTNDWTQFSVRAFNGSQLHVRAERRLRALPDQLAASLNRPEVEFASFFGIDVASETRTWLDQFWSRFNDSYAAVWSVADVNETWSRLLSTSTCDADVTSHVDNVERLLQQLLDVSHADTTRYHVTDSTVTSSSDDERQGDVTPEVESAAAAWLDEYWRHAWTLFLTLDLLLVVARATVTYVNAAQIYRGGRQSQSYHQPAVSAVNHCVANGQAGGSAVCSRLKAKTADQVDRQSTWSWVLDSIGSRSLLFIVHLSSLVVLLYLATRVATSSAAVDVIVHVIYDVYRRRVRVHLSMSDAVAREQAKLITSALTQSPQQLDLIALHVFDQYFRLGLKNTTDCDDVGPLDDVLLPCQLLPVLSLTNTGVGAVLEFEQQLLSDLRRYATAVQRLFITIINSLLVVVITAVTTRLISCVLSRSRDLHHVVDTRHSGDDDVSTAQPATVSVNAQTRNFTVFDLRFSETKV